MKIKEMTDSFIMSEINKHANKINILNNELRLRHSRILERENIANNQTIRVYKSQIKELESKISEMELVVSLPKGSDNED